MCHGEGSLEESLPGGYFDQSAETFYPLEQSRECSLCKGVGSIETPHHPNTFNLTPEYAQLKETRQSKRSSKNAVALAYILDIPVNQVEQDQTEQNLKRAA